MIRLRSRKLWVVLLLVSGAGLAASRWVRQQRFERLAAVLEKDDLGKLEALLQKGADPNVRSDEGTRPLHLAKSAGAIRLLLERGGRIDAKTSTGNTPLHMAAYFENPEAVAELLKSGAPVDARNDEGDTPLHLLSTWIINGDVSPEFHEPPLNRYAPTGQGVRTLGLLLAAGANVEAKNARGETPAYTAALGPGRPEMLKELLERGASTTVVNVNGRPMLGDEYSRAMEPIRSIVVEAEAKRGTRR